MKSRINLILAVKSHRLLFLASSFVWLWVCVCCYFVYVFRSEEKKKLWRSLVQRHGEEEQNNNNCKEFSVKILTKCKCLNEIKQTMMLTMVFSSTHISRLFTVRIHAVSLFLHAFCEFFTKYIRWTMQKLYLFTVCFQFFFLVPPLKLPFFRFLGENALTEC